MNRLDNRRHALNGIEAIKAESELKSALSRSRRCERKSRQRVLPLVAVLTLLVALTVGIGVAATFGEATGIVLCLFTVVIIAIIEEIRRVSRDH